MAVPKRKRSRARRDSRHANKFIKTKEFASCSNCQGVLTPHAVCMGCGFYKGKKIMKTKLDRSLTRADVRSKKIAKNEVRDESKASDSE